ncbi:alkaline phosphatase [Pseudovirgaria hyperparasitica]|uniref:Alkaline phosphatase n=1 Tax=Pseudovirgaria hyperparasitica TaxID=470096 RepID=A0A6A6WI94_9PEZI|nr:alkaline phosphatase [Pseudovirgaria hyperparasitica]KAF2762522.1 alkaline phosphatase [Pseudovirgaria hyperparasitica]
MRFFFIILLAFSSTVSATFDGNLNYHSPSRRHPALGIDVPKVAKRSSVLRRRTNNITQSLNFTHGVASGDPFPHSVILWTRIAPQIDADRSNATVSGLVPLYNHDTEKYIQADPHPICVKYNVWTDEKGKNVIDSGTAYTTSDIDWTIKVEANNLQPFTNYYYQFEVCNQDVKSTIGRTKTSPTEDDEEAQIGLAVYSCGNCPNGYFNAYGNAARKDDIDYVIHLGDYIYETSRGVLGQDPRATNPPKEIFSLYDYRTRIGQYRLDSDLQLSHAKFPWIPTWDDHEQANNGFRDGFSNMNNTEDSFVKSGGVSVDQRKMNAVRAYFEWMPIRQVDMDDGLRVWRSFKLGKIADLIILDTRNYDRSITDLSYNEDYIYDIANDAGRSLMGSRQENWFYRSLSESDNRGAVWKIIGNQIIFSRINQTVNYGQSMPFNVDQWDGYLSNRNRTFYHLYENKIQNTVFLAGDSHANWVSDLVWLDEHAYDENTGLGAVGVEFAGTAVSSSGYASNVTDGQRRSQSLVTSNPELQWSEGYYRGYFELHVTKNRMDARYFGTPTVAFETPLELSLANFTVLAGDNHLQRPLSGGVVENGYLKGGQVISTNVTLNTETGEWNTTSFPVNYIQYPRT